MAENDFERRGAKEREIKLRFPRLVAASIACSECLNKIAAAEMSFMMEIEHEMRVMASMIYQAAKCVK